MAGNVVDILPLGVPPSINRSPTYLIIKSSNKHQRKVKRILRQYVSPNNWEE